MSVPVTEYVKAWQCIGCGKIEAPQTCVGICQDRRVEFVYASDYEEALARTDEVRQRVTTLEAIVRQLATIVPRDGEWERSYRALQERARKALAEHQGTTGEQAPSGASARSASGGSRQPSQDGH